MNLEGKLLCLLPCGLLMMGTATPVLAVETDQEEKHHIADEATDESPIPAGFVKGEGFRFKSADSQNVLRISLQAGIKVEPAWNDGDHVMDGTFPFLRPMIRGSVYRDWINYRLSFEAADVTPFVLDAFVDLTPWEEFNVMLGQQGTLVSRHSNQAPQTIFFPEFAPVSSYFWSGRERGATVYGSVFEQRVDYFTGLYGGSPIDEPVNIADNYVAEARLTVNPLGPVNGTEHPFDEEGGPLPFRISFTAQGYYGRLQTGERSYNLSNGLLEPAVTLNTEEVIAGSGDLWIQGGPFVVFGEGYYRNIKPVGGDEYSSVGAWGQVAVALYRNLVAGGVRGGWLDPADGVDDNEAFELEGQVVYYVNGPDLALKLRYGYINQQSPDDPGDAALPFLPGKSHVATLQLTLFF